MRRFGFSSGALANGDFRAGVAMLHNKAIHALELSALRQIELRPMLDGIDGLDLTQFEYIAFHAPSQFNPEDEEEIVEALAGVCDRGWPVVLHPDAVHNFALWRSLGQMLCVENMDKRKPIGRTVSELEWVFDQLPEASFCFDIGHARQVDSTMAEAYFILKRFGRCLRQVHLSEVNTCALPCCGRGRGVQLETKWSPNSAFCPLTGRDHGLRILPS